MTPYKWRTCPYGGAYYLEKPSEKNPRHIQRIATVEKRNGVGYRIEIEGVCVVPYVENLLEAKKIAAQQVRK